MSVGSVAVQLQFGLYVFGYLSKLAFHFMFIVVRLFVVVSSVRLACNLLIHATNLPNTCHYSEIGAGLLRLAKGNGFIYKSSNGDRIC